MRKNPYGRILEGELKEQHLSTIPKSCPKLKQEAYFKKISKQINK